MNIRRQHPRTPWDLFVRGLIFAAVLWAVAFALTWLASELYHYRARNFSTPNQNTEHLNQ